MPAASIPLDALRREARSHGIPWCDVQDAYRDLKSQEWENRQYPNEIRQAAWTMATGSTPGAWPFWRHGFTSRWGARVERSDFTAVPGYDEIAQEIGSLFPEYAGPDGTERLFEFLFSPYRRMPLAETLYRQAIDRLRNREPVPF
jgi:hypothetical protein